MQELLEYPSEVIIDSYYRAFVYRSTRAEPLYRIANIHRKNKDYLAGYEIAKQGILINKPNDILFLENWIYEWGLPLEFSICAYWLEKYDEALSTSLQLLENEDLPTNVRECVENNLIWIRSNL